MPDEKQGGVFFEDLVAHAQRWRQAQDEDVDVEATTFSLALERARGSAWVPLAERLEQEPQRSDDHVNWWLYLCTRGDPPRPLLGDGGFAGEAELLACAPDDPLVTFENILALARLYEQARNTSGAWTGLCELKAMIARAGDERQIAVCLREMESFCWNHALDREGVKVCEERALVLQDTDRTEYGFALIQKAFFLGRSEGAGRGLDFFESLRRDLSDHDWLPLNLARYMTEHGQVAEAADEYRELIGRREEADDEAVMCAFAEVQPLLKALGRADEARALAEMARDLFGDEF